MLEVFLSLDSDKRDLVLLPVLLPSVLILQIQEGQRSWQDLHHPEGPQVLLTISSATSSLLNLLVTSTIPLIMACVS